MEAHLYDMAGMLPLVVAGIIYLYVNLAMSIVRKRGK